MKVGDAVIYQGVRAVVREIVDKPNKSWGILIHLQESVPFSRARSMWLARVHKMPRDPKGPFAKTRRVRCSRSDCYHHSVDAVTPCNVCPNCNSKLEKA